MVDNVILKKSGGKKSMKECRRGNMLPHGVKRLMNKVTRFPIDRKTGPPSFLALVALICRNPIDIVRKCCWLTVENWLWLESNQDLHVELGIQIKVK